MNKEKTGGVGRIIAFFIIAAALALTLGAASGSGAGASDNTKKPTPEEPENTDKPSIGAPEDEDTPADTEPTYRYNYLTGLKEDLDTPVFKPTAYVMSTDAALYGVSFADVLIEVPIEGGDTRFISVCPYGAKMGKVGAISPTRGYISGLAESFGSTLVSYGQDDTRAYPCVTPSEHLDLSSQSGYHYTEYTKYAYSNADLIHRALANSSLGLSAPSTKLPFEFLPEGERPSPSSFGANKVVLPYSASDKTELIYSESDGCYTMAKGGAALYDMLNGSSPSFKNLFLLYADSVTYETENEVAFIMNTFTSGKGVYVTEGCAVNIRWECNEAGEMTFFSENGKPLRVNRGKSYVAFFKASITSQIEII